MHQARELVRVVGHLESQGIRVMPFKGPVLGTMAYGNLAFRQSLDLDLLVQPDHYSRAEHLIRELGYVPFRSLTPKERVDFVEWHASDDYWHPEKKIMVELHYDFFKDIVAEVLDDQGAWSRHEHMPFAGTTVRRLALEDLVIHVCAHGAQHRWSKLKWLCDLAGLIRRQSAINWDRVEERSADTGSRRMVHLGLFLVNRCLEVPLPNRFHNPTFPDATTKRLADTVRQDWLFAPPDTDVDPIQEFWFHFREREHWRDRTPYVLHSVRLAVRPTEKDHTFLPLPPSLDWLYYLVRPVRLARDYLLPGTRRGG
jgi:hypothetical protein